MRKEKALAVLLQDLVSLLVEESDQNPEFSASLEELLEVIPERRKPRMRKKSTETPKAVPDVYAEWNARGEIGFRLWLQERPIATIRDVIRAQDLDPTRRTSRWKDAEKLAGFVSDGLRARLSRGSSFITSRQTERDGE